VTTDGTRFKRRLARMRRAERPRNPLVLAAAH